MMKSGVCTPRTLDEGSLACVRECWRSAGAGTGHLPLLRRVTHARTPLSTPARACPASRGTLIAAGLKDQAPYLVHLLTGPTATGSSPTDRDG
jgi:hypothetical protein